MWLWAGAAIIAAAGLWYLLGPGRPEPEPAPQTHNPNPPLMGVDEYQIQREQYANRQRQHEYDDLLFRHEFGRIKNYFRNIS